MGNTRQPMICDRNKYINGATTTLPSNRSFPKMRSSNCVSRQISLHHNYSVKRSSREIFNSLKFSLQFFSFCVLIGVGSSNLPFPCRIGDDEVTQDNMTTIKDINIYMLLPNDDRYMASIRQTGPAMNLSWHQVLQRNLLPGYRINLHYRDTECSNVLAPMVAIKAHFAQKNLHAFFGPSCELALAPVARFVKFWNIPLLTAGGLTVDYTMDKKMNGSEYFLLTKTGIGFSGMSNFILKIFAKAGWKKVLLMYEKDGRDDVSGPHTCKFFMSTVVDDLKKFVIDYDTLDLENTANVSLHERMGDSMRSKYAMSADRSSASLFRSRD
ncbi:unnamed protein product [Allacma fusca]|uniref:Receptor ligand binding region domain-containing protein n=1 Tax=Allacma fusca TaxID=39272 RepID=A0A8J2JUE5_9HEXA|nr:unnamed protein product [Allacma fusca]